MGTEPGERSVFLYSLVSLRCFAAGSHSPSVPPAPAPAPLLFSFLDLVSPPFDDYDDCDGVKYMVQLSIYRYLLQRHYGLTISSTRLVSFHPRQDTFLAIDVPDMDAEVQALFAARGRGARPH